MYLALSYFRYAHPLVYSVNYNNDKHCTDIRWRWDVRVCFWCDWQTHQEGVVPSKYPGPNWGSAQAPAPQAITVTTRAPCAAGRECCSAVPYLSPPLSCLSPMTARKAHSSQYVLEKCLATWNIHFLLCWMAMCIFIYCGFCDTCDRFRGELEGCCLQPPKGGGRGEIRGADHHNQGLFLIYHSPYHQGHRVNVINGFLRCMDN